MTASIRGRKVLIVSFEGDIHADAVAWALRERGHQPVLWFVNAFPDPQRITVRIGRDGQCGIALRERDGREAVELSDVDVVWMRRYSKPLAPRHAHPADRDVIEAEGDAFLRGLLEMLPQDAFWVNPLGTARRANQKPVQLVAAARAGLTVPETRFSNDPADVRAMHERFNAAGDGIILKTFRQQHWRTRDTSLLLPTTPVREDVFRDPSSIGWCPAIYQPRLAKAFEVRATVMGREVLSLRLNSQEREETTDDCRLMPAFRASVSPYELPADIEAKSLALMRSLGIVFGCIDFVVTPEGEHVFLEVNEMGQFLWVETASPAIPMLATFSEFLASMDGSFERAAGSTDELDFSRYISDEARRKRLDAQMESFKQSVQHQPRRVMEA